MHKSVYEKIRRQVEKRGRGVVFVTREMLGFGSRAAVDEALARLAKEEVVRRLARGLYDYPRLHETLGPVPADPDEIASALARKNGGRIQGAGSRAANALGLSPQVPARPVYLTDGRRRTIQIGGQIIELRHAVPRAMAGAGRAEGAVIQALRHLGQEHIDADIIENLRRTLTAREKAALRREALNAPGWLVPFLQEIGRSEARTGRSNIQGQPEGADALERQNEAAEKEAP
jgi:hypothetical protein